MGFITLSFLVVSSLGLTVLMSLFSFSILHNLYIWRCLPGAGLWGAGLCCLLWLPHCLHRGKLRHHVFVIWCFQIGAFTFAYFCWARYKKGSHRMYILFAIMIMMKMTCMLFLTPQWYTLQSSTYPSVWQVRLVLTVVFGTSMGAVGLVLGCRYWQSQNLIFRTVGADSSIQALCRTLFTTITLIMFDAQIVVS